MILLPIFDELHDLDAVGPRIVELAGLEEETQLLPLLLPFYPLVRKLKCQEIWIRSFQFKYSICPCLSAVLTGAEINGILLVAYI